MPIGAKAFDYTDMSCVNPNHIDAWLESNLRSVEGPHHPSLKGSPTGAIRLRVLPVVLAIAALVVAITWYSEASNGLLNAVDRLGYPSLLLVTSTGALLLLVRPTMLRIVMVAVFTTYLTHLLGVYYLFLVNLVYFNTSSTYELTSLALWLPFSYVVSFVFFSPRAALRTSLGIYAATSLPLLWLLLGVESDAVARETAIAVLIAQPIYISALWGVGLLKSHVSGVHDHARSMRAAATVDYLTGVANRRAMLHALETFASVASSSRRAMSLLLLDVDHFKKINDTFGHATGDEVLISLANHTNAHLRASDLLGRWGGEEFIILTLDQSGAQAMQMAERLRMELEKSSHPHNEVVTVSIGVTSYLPGERIDELIKRADEALYRAKERGRNCVAEETVDVSGF